MKKFNFFIGILVLGFISLSCAENINFNKKYFYLGKNDIPDNVNIFPKSPEVSDPIFENDKIEYEEGKKIRNTKRGEQAKLDVIWNEDSIDRIFSQAFGFKISNKHTPEIYTLLNNVVHDIKRFATKGMKTKYKRVRPYRYYNEKTCYPKSELKLFYSGSYPSGHAAYGWAVALILSEINPNRQTEILKRGYEIGESRVICGYHWRSDIDVGRLIGSIMVAKLHTKDKFIKQLDLAKKEFNKLNH